MERPITLTEQAAMNPKMVKTFRIIIFSFVIISVIYANSSGLIQSYLYNRDQMELWKLLGGSIPLLTMFGKWWLLGSIFSQVVFGGPDKGSITDIFGRKVNLKKNLSGDYTGDDGNTYSDNHDGTVTKE